MLYKRLGTTLRAYLDIETTFSGSISVIGIYRPDIGTIQLVGGGVRDLALYEALEGVGTLVTFNGTCFDLPVIKRRIQVDLKRDFEHCDLMYVCRKRDLRGGLKKIEASLGIARETAGITGWDAPRLWDRFEQSDDKQALATLLHYNREDVVNLALLETVLGMSDHGVPCTQVRHVFA